MFSSYLVQSVTKYVVDIRLNDNNKLKTNYKTMFYSKLKLPELKNT